MSGIFSIGEKKVRPGVYYRRENSGGVETVGATNGVAAVLFQADWGALNEEFDMDVTMQNSVADYYGTADTVSAIKEAFKGGATTVRAVRIGGDDGKSGSIELKNTEGSPVTAVTITAAHPGTRSFTVSVRTNLITDHRQVIIYNGTDIFEQFSFAAGEKEPENLVAAMAQSKNFVAKAEDGVKGPLAAITQQPLTGGKNPTVNTASYEKGTDILERYKWNCIVADTDDSAVQLLLQNFVVQSYQTGHLGFASLAGKSTQALTERMTQAASFNDEKIVYTLNGWTGSDGTKYEGWRAAARIGGMIAAFEANTSLTHNVITNAVSLIEPLTNGEIIKAETKGCLVLTLNDSDQVWIDSAINTLVTPDATMDEGWKKIRRTKTRFELMDRVDSTCEKLVGNINNDTDGRQTFMATAQKVINAMIEEKKLMSGSTVYEDPGNPAEGDSAWFKLAIDDIDSVEKIYLTYQFRFAPERTEKKGE